MPLKNKIDIEKLKLATAPSIIRMQGKKYGRLTVVKILGTLFIKTNIYRHYIECLCECGTLDIFEASTVKRGHTQSCGCYQIEWTKNKHTTHGHSQKRTKSRAYNSWLAMKSRCYDSRHKHYPVYGGAGIKVCSRWLNCFENFLEDMGEPPVDYTLDRFPDMSGNYEPSNCRWANKEQQQNNTKRNRFIFYEGERLTLAQASRKFKFSISKARRIFRDQNKNIEYRLTYKK